MNSLFIILILLSYLFGSINFAIWFTYIKTGTDIRELGDHNAGAENVGKNVSVGLGFMVFILDFSKGLIPLIIAKQIGAPGTVLLLVGVAAILGHDYPIFYHFKGGSGTATTIGCALFFAPKETILIYSFIIPLGLFIQYIRDKKGSNLPRPATVATFIFYIYLISLVFVPSISNTIKMFSLIALSIIALRRLNETKYFLRHKSFPSFLR